MSRMNNIEARLSMLHVNGRQIVFLVSEERNILKSVFAKAKATVRSLAAYPDLDKITCAGEEFYKYLKKQGYLMEIYDEKDIDYRFMALTGNGKTGKTSAGSAKPEENALKSDKTLFYVYTDFHTVKEDKQGIIIKKFLSMAEFEYRERARHITLFLVSPFFQIPDGFGSEIEVIDIPDLDDEDIEALLLEEAEKEISEKKKFLDSTDKLRVKSAQSSFKGLTVPQIKEIIKNLQSEHGSFYGQSGEISGTKENHEAITKSRDKKINTLKDAIARQDNTITILPKRKSKAGLEKYDKWLGEVKNDFTNPIEAAKWGNKPPKGVLLTGIPGTGKTQAAKHTAAVLDIPLIQLRMDNLLGGLVGLSEANFKRCRKRIESLAPCVVLIDEIEKTFGKDSQSGHDTKMNIFSALLDWMQESEKPIFFYATSNSVSKLPDELLRDGRFDMRFYTFMPAHNELVRIVNYHMNDALKLSKGELYSGFGNKDAAFEKIGTEFLQRITKYADDKEKKRNMFYTGANIQNLIAQINRKMRINGKYKYSANDFLEEMLICAQSDYSQPQGMSSFDKIVSFWIDMLEKRYADAAENSLFSFSNFDQENAKFIIDPPMTWDYDKYMYRQISSEIIKQQEKINEKSK